MPFLDVEQLVKSFGSRRALGGLSFSVEPGEVYGLVGPNGAGKTTTINVICNLLRPDAGRVTLDREPCGDRTRTGIGIASQEVALYRDLTCAQNLEFFGGLYGLRGRDLAARVTACLRAVDLEERRESLVSSLSGGMQRRLHIAIAILHEPRLLILDEPTVGLDLEARHRVWGMIRGVESEGRATLLTTHHLEEAERLCGRIGILSEGRLAAEGTMAELRALIPAAELALIEAGELSAVRQRARELGLTYRDANAAVVVWLPERVELEKVAAHFRGIELRSLSLKPVGLEEIYAEITTNELAASSRLSYQEPC